MMLKTNTDEDVTLVSKLSKKKSPKPMERSTWSTLKPVKVVCQMAMDSNSNSNFHLNGNSFQVVVNQVNTKKVIPIMSSHMFQQKNHTKKQHTRQKQPNTLPRHTPHQSQKHILQPSIRPSQHTNQHTNQHINLQQSTLPSTLHQRRFTPLSTPHQRRFTPPSTPHQRSKTMVNQPITMDTLSTQVQSQFTINTAHGLRTDTPANTINITQVTAERVHAMPNTLPDALVICSTLSTPNSAPPRSITPKLLSLKSPKISSVSVKPQKITGELNVTSLNLPQPPVHKDVTHSLISLVKISCQQNQPTQDTTTMIMAEREDLKELLLDHVTFLLVTLDVMAWTSIQPKLHKNLSLRSKQ